MARFPFRRTVGQNLRQLFAHDRLLAQSNQLGYSSLSPGEGSFDIRDAAGADVARYGHHAGKAGFLVPNGSGWQTIQERIAAENAVLVGRLDSHAQRIGAAENDITAASTRLDAHGTRLGFVESDVSTLKGRADSHAQRIGAAENDIDMVEKDIVGITSGQITLSAPKVGGIGPQAIGSTWKVLVFNPATGRLGYQGD